ncbi:hypothetical protein SEA_XKCD_5 [Mycobacterium phage xkcd]|nr:hypothetical protein SEA_XKCD_5 [Mycobacterium phage xkcd]
MTAQYPALPPMTAWQKELLAILLDADLTLTYRRYEPRAVIDALLEGLEDG